MSEKIGCMNCGNISCKNNKKRESNGCGRWKTPEQRILELEEKVGMVERTRDRLISIGFPTFASCKEYAAKLNELEAQIEKMKNRCNCKNGEYSCVGRAYFNCKLGINKCEGCNKWEIKEND